jgi:hypothetical protein
MLQLDADADQTRVRAYGIREYPAFAVLDCAGGVRVPPDNTMFQLMLGDPMDAVNTLMGNHYRLWSEAHGIPPSADVVIAQLRFLKAYHQDDVHDDLLKRALANQYAKPEEIACLKVYKALFTRWTNPQDDAKKADGLALLKEVAPDLTLAEADGAKLEHATAPFTVKRGDAVYGTVSSATDPRLTYDALAWMNKLRGEIPPPAGMTEETLLAGATSLACVLSRPTDADAWVQAYKKKVGADAFKETSRALYAEGLVLVSQGKLKEGVEDLAKLAAEKAGESFAPTVAVEAYEILTKANEKDTAKQVKEYLKVTYGVRLPGELKERVPGYMDD